MSKTSFPLRIQNDERERAKRLAEALGVSENRLYAELIHDGMLIREQMLYMGQLRALAAGTPLQDALAVLVARLNSLARDYSGVRPILLERLALMINRRILPRIPEEGSVGASGDLTPLSYVGAALVGEREVLFEGRISAAAQISPVSSSAANRTFSISCTGSTSIVFPHPTVIPYPCEQTAWMMSSPTPPSLKSSGALMQCSSG